jgi:hypothetical protein
MPDVVGFGSVIAGGGLLLGFLCYIPGLSLLQRRGRLAEWNALTSGVFTATVLTLPAYIVLGINARDPGKLAAGEATTLGATFALCGFTFGVLYRLWCLTKR